MCILEGQCHEGAEHTQRTAARVAKPGLRVPIGGGVFACMNCPEPRGQTGLEFYSDSDLWGNLIEPHPTEISIRWHSQYNSTSVPSWELTGKFQITTQPSTDFNTWESVLSSLAFTDCSSLAFKTFAECLSPSYVKVPPVVWRSVVWPWLSPPSFQKAYVDDIWPDCSNTSTLWYLSSALHLMLTLLPMCCVCSTCQDLVSWKI